MAFKNARRILGLFIIVAALFATIGLPANAVQASSLPAASPCECGQYIVNRYGINTHGMETDAARAFVEILGNNGFRRVSFPQVGAVVVMQPTFFPRPQDNSYGHAGVIVKLADQDDQWAITLRQASSTQRSGSTEANCSNIRDVNWKPYSKEKDNQSISYWLPPDPKGSAIDTSRTYLVINANSSKALDVRSDEAKDNTRVTQWDENGGANQQVKFETVNMGDGRNWYNIKFVASGRYLAVKLGSMDPGAQVFQWISNRGDYARWLLISRRDGNYALQNRNSGLVLAIADSNWANNADLVQWPRMDTADQQWILQAEQP